MARRMKYEGLLTDSNAKNDVNHMSGKGTNVQSLLKWVSELSLSGIRTDPLVRR